MWRGEREMVKQKKKMWNVIALSKLQEKRQVITIMTRRDGMIPAC